MRGEGIFSIIAILIIIPGVCVLFGSMHSAREKTLALREAKAKDILFQANSELKRVFSGRLGKYGGAPVFVYVGDAGIVVDAVSNPVAHDIPYEDILSVFSSVPDIPQLRNLNAGAVIANQIARDQVGTSVIFSVTAGHRDVDVVIGGMKEADALALEDLLLRGIDRRS